VSLFIPNTDASGDMVSYEGRLPIGQIFSEMWGRATIVAKHTDDYEE
jgi:hypothetical protein